MNENIKGVSNKKRFVSKRSAVLWTTSALCLTAATSAMAGGFDRGGVNVDLLFDQKQYVMQGSVTRVMPQREIKNVKRLDGSLSSSSIDVNSDYTIPSVGIKFDLHEDLSCLASYSRPTGIDSNYGTGNAYSPTTVELSIDTNDYGLTCGYRIPMGETALGNAQMRLIGGVSYLELDGFQTRQSYLALGATGMGRIELSDEAFGWRAGVAYEIPDIALRAQLVYQSKYDLDSLSGNVNITGYGVPANMGGITPITAATEIPQSLEFKLQSGINESTLLFGSVKWQEWSQLQQIVINNQIGQNLSLNPFYEDGWTVTGGIGKKITDELSGKVALTWDKGTATFTGSQTDTWMLSGGLSHKLNDNSELAFGGMIGIMEGGKSGPTPNDSSGAVSYDFDADMVYALSASLKINF